MSGRHVSVETRRTPQILVVEDSDDFTHALAILLRQHGLKPVIFHTAGPAIEFAKTNVPDAALLDIHLPDLSGLELSRQLRERWGNDVPMVILSGDNSMETLRSLPADGGTTFFSKPVNASVLLAHLKKVLAPR